MRAKRAATIALLACLGCGPKKGQSGAEAPAGDEAEGKPVDVEAMFAREATDLEKAKVADPGKAWTAVALGKGEPKVSKQTGVSIVEIPIGSETPVRCQVFADDVDSAGSVSALLKDVGSRVELKQVTPAGMYVANETPVAFVDAIYHAQVEGGKAAGELKFAVHPASGNPVLCIHDEAGFRKTFAEVALEFCKSLTPARPLEPPRFVEVQTARLGELAVGFNKMSLVGSGDERKLLSMSAMFLPVGPGELHLVDNYTVETIDASDYLKQGIWVEATGGEVGMNITLTRDKGPLYKYEGTLQGKPIKGEFRSKNAKGLLSSIASAKKLAGNAKGSKVFSFPEEQYIPDLDPTKPFQVRYFREKGAPEGAVQFEAGKMNFVGQIDEQGLVQQMELPMGANKLGFKREFIRGKIGG